jgi:hypothetical protein
MKFTMILPVVAALAMFQLVPQAAWSQCYPGYMSRHEARRIWRAEHNPYYYGAYAQPAPYACGNPYYGYHGGLLTGVARAIF